MIERDGGRPITPGQFKKISPTNTFLAALTPSERLQAYKLATRLTDRAHGDEIYTAAIRLAFFAILADDGHEDLARRIRVYVMDAARQRARRLRLRGTA